jgi:hypothetical protein
MTTTRPTIEQITLAGILRRHSARTPTGAYLRARRSGRWVWLGVDLFGCPAGVIWPEATRAVCAELADHLSWLRYFSQARGGVSVSRFQGVIGDWHAPYAAGDVFLQALLHAELGDGVRCERLAPLVAAARAEVESAGDRKSARRRAAPPIVDQLAERANALAARAT